MTRLTARLVDAAAIVGWLAIIAAAAVVDALGVREIPAESEETPW